MPQAGAEDVGLLHHGIAAGVRIQIACQHAEARPVQGGTEIGVAGEQRVGSGDLVIHADAVLIVVAICALADPIVRASGSGWEPACTG